MDNVQTQKLRATGKREKIDLNARSLLMVRKDGWMDGMNE